MTRYALSAIVAATIIACQDRPAPEESFRTTRVFPHDETSYTQGLVWDDTTLYESTGQYRRSQLRQLELQSGRVIRSRRLPDDRFGEGLALLHGKLYQLTWQSGVAYVYDKHSFNLIDSLRYPGEGWGLATYGDSLMMSDGSDSLRVLSPTTFEVKRVVHVRFEGEPLHKLNELEYVNGNILANVYESDWIVRIDPVTGIVNELLDFADLYPKRTKTAEVMNGIALSPIDGELLLTGKQWPKLFQVSLRPGHNAAAITRPQPNTR